MDMIDSINWGSGGSALKLYGIPCKRLDKPLEHNDIALSCEHINLNYFRA
jgi:hypothetical protein